MWEKPTCIGLFAVSQPWHHEDFMQYNSEPVERDVLCIVWGLAVPLASNLEMSIEFLLPILWQSKISSKIARCPLERHITCGWEPLNYYHTPFVLVVSLWLVPWITGHIEHLRKEMHIMQGIWWKKRIWTLCSLFNGKRACAFTLLKTKEDKYANSFHGLSSSDGALLLMALAFTTNGPRSAKNQESVHLRKSRGIWTAWHCEGINRWERQMRAGEICKCGRR